MGTGSGHFFEMPHSRIGRWSIGLAAAFVGMFSVNSFVFMPLSSNAPWRHAILPFYGILMLLCGLAAGILGLLAVVGQHERSGLVWFTMLPGLLVLLFVVGEFLFPH
jgi:hypothetical protein